MKKTIILALVLVLNISIVSIADSQNVGQEQQMQAGQGQQIQMQTEQQTQNQGEETNLMIQQIIQQRMQWEIQKLDEIKETVQQRKQEMNQEIQQMEKSEQKVYQNQNEVRLAVHSLLSMEEVLGGIGQQVSQIAKEFNNSVQATIKAEERIENRNRLVKFFTGGDEEAAGMLEQEMERNEIRIRQLMQLSEQCACGDDVKAVFQEQIMKMEQEQSRLQQIAQGEKQAKGIFGWLFGWLRK
ncbi:MAG TPA: hypothetical protein VMW21_00660 [Patescibacteria group bacterium]|nr:hypothetical protein [Patescibacteria group bacterium]